ncbi:hypothetical protein LSS_17255 [Leptospira santarosai serovar Shermani str. LT 821]|uniref:Uncharacterized protein n=1 Tax=Leptospira santarosai serovar Shermani str. LT 821 TaxID=758847 RepID=K8XVF7_9LEPT|nr:hypothetical protein LSS_17255 [Leptospira santarosai serovar Shermani str. LT 821]
MSQIDNFKIFSFFKNFLPAIFHSNISTNFFLRLIDSKKIRI